MSNSDQSTSYTSNSGSCPNNVSSTAVSVGVAYVGATRNRHTGAGNY